MSERASEHRPDGPSVYVRGVGWARACVCGRVFKSEQGWEHVPAAYDHFAVPSAYGRLLAVGDEALIRESLAASPSSDGAA
jgi:hypothetical protein